SGDRVPGYEWYTSAIEGNVTVKLGTYELKRVTIQVNGYAGIDEHGNPINLGTMYEDISPGTDHFSFSILPQTLESNPDCRYILTVSVLDTEGNEIQSKEQVLYIEMARPVLEIQAFTSFDPQENILEEEYPNLEEESPWTPWDIQIKFFHTNTEVQTEIEYKVKTAEGEWRTIEDPSDFLITCKEGDTLAMWYEFQAVSLKTGLASNSIFRYVKIDKEIPMMPVLTLNPQKATGEHDWYPIFPSILVKRSKTNGSSIKTKVEIVYQDSSTRTFYLKGEGEDELFLERDGICKVTAVSEDEVGYRSKISTIEEIKVDTTKPLTPKISIDSKIVKKWFITNHTINVHFASEDAGSGISHFQYKLVPKGQKIEEIPFLIGESFYLSPQFQGDLYVYAVDKAGNSTYQGGTIEEGEMISLTLEDIPPTIQIQSDVDLNRWQNEDVSLNIAVKDSLSGIRGIFYTYGGVFHEVEMDESSMYDTSFSIVCKKDHVKSNGEKINIKAVDYAGNISEESIEVKIDKTLPVLSVSGVEEGGHYQQDLTLSIQVDENNLKEEGVTAIVERTLGDKTLSQKEVILKDQDGYQLILKEEGIYQINIRAEDKAGNKSIFTCSNVMIDKTAPKITVTGGKNHQISSRPLALSIHIEDQQDDLPKIEYEIKRRDLHKVTTILPSKEFQQKEKKHVMEEELKEDGVYTLEIKAKDQCGNESFIKRQITIDTQDPVIHYIDELEGAYLQSFLFMYKMQDLIEDLTFSNYEITLDGLPFDVKKEVVEEGPHILKVTVYDEVGHEGTASARFIIDHTKPVILFLDITEEGFLENERCNIILLDEYDWFEEILINGETYLLEEKTHETTLHLEEVGDYEIIVKAKDLAGNEIEETQQFTYRMKTTEAGEKIRLDQSGKDQSGKDQNGKDQNDLNEQKQKNNFVLFLITLMILGGAGALCRFMKSKKKLG
ncbi:MAG TPA: hypothetical protein IAC41_10955, partial [Candidatus Merdenecus merdavium]|nr:hypothetical protein [Candidatus Merdenecus merdavium]